jgi:hypothetical protein
MKEQIEQLQQEAKEIKQNSNDAHVAANKNRQVMIMVKIIGLASLIFFRISPT